MSLDQNKYVEQSNIVKYNIFYKTGDIVECNKVLYFNQNSHPKIAN